MFKKPLLPGLLWTLVIALLTLLPGNYVPEFTSFLDWIGPDKLIHLFLFGIYTLLLIFGFLKQSKSDYLRRNAVIISLLVGMVFAFFTEVMQAWIVPGRNGNIYDFLADGIGCLLGWVSWHIIRKIW